MVVSAITFMGTMLSGTERESEVNAAVGDCLDQIASYKDYQLGLLPDVRDNFTAEIRRSISRQDMLEIVVWFYLTMTNQFQMIQDQTRIVFNKVAPIEREVIYNWLSVALD